MRSPRRLAGEGNQCGLRGEGAALEVVAEGREHVAQRRCHLDDVLAEHGAAEGGERVPHRQGVEVDRSAGGGTRLAPRQEVAGGGGDGPQMGRDRSPGEQRLGDAPVTQPSLTPAYEEPVAEEMAELADDGRVLDVVAGIPRQDLMGAFGREHGIELEPHTGRAHAEAGDVAVGRHGLRVGAELVALQLPGTAQQQRAAGRRRRECHATVSHRRRTVSSPTWTPPAFRAPASPYTRS